MVGWVHGRIVAVTIPDSQVTPGCVVGNHAVMNIDVGKSPDPAQAQAPEGAVVANRQGSAWRVAGSILSALSSTHLAGNPWT